MSNFNLRQCAVVCWFGTKFWVPRIPLLCNKKHFFNSLSRSSNRNRMEASFRMRHQQIVVGNNEEAFRTTSNKGTMRWRSLARSRAGGAKRAGGARCAGYVKETHWWRKVRWWRKVNPLTCSAFPSSLAGDSLPFLLLALFLIGLSDRPDTTLWRHANIILFHTDQLEQGLRPVGKQHSCIQTSGVGFTSACTSRATNLKYVF